MYAYHGDKRALVHSDKEMDRLLSGDAQATRRWMRLCTHGRIVTTRAEGADAHSEATAAAVAHACASGHDVVKAKIDCTDDAFMSPLELFHLYATSSTH